MITYDQSLDNLPDTVLVVDRREGLLEIRDPDYNLVIWTREEDPSITDFFRRVSTNRISDKSKRDFKRRVGGLGRHLRRHKGRANFLGEYGRLHAIMDKLQRNRNRNVLSIMDSAVAGYSFHQDEGLSLNWTLAGPPGLWVENHHVRAINSRFYTEPDNLSVIRQFPDHAVMVYKGFTEQEREECPDRLPLVHTRSNRSAIRRVLHQIYL